MNTITIPIAASFSLSVVLHSAALAVLLLTVEQVTSSGQGVEIELIRSIRVAEQQETDIPEKNNRADKPLLQSELEARTDKPVANVQTQQQRLSPVLIANNSDVYATRPPVKDSAVTQQQASNTLNQNRRSAEDGFSTAQFVLSTNATGQQHSIIELLHSRISDHKEYPYIARRQGREGVATVGFMLHPDGSIENARLLNSSRASILDRAALSAVKHIEPFEPAQEYIEHAEEFRINVVFNLHE